MSETNEGACSRRFCRWCGTEGHPFCSDFCRDRWRRAHKVVDGSLDHEGCRPNEPGDPIADLVAAGEGYNACYGWLEDTEPDGEGLGSGELADNFVEEYPAAAPLRTDAERAAADFLDYRAELADHIREIREVPL